MALCPCGKEIVTFEEFLARKNIGKEAEVVPLLKESWNQALETVVEHGGEMGAKTINTLTNLRAK